MEPKHNFVVFFLFEPLALYFLSFFFTLYSHFSLCVNNHIKPQLLQPQFNSALDLLQTSFFFFFFFK